MGTDPVFCGADNTGLDFAGAARAEEKILVIVEWRDIVATAGWEEEPEIPTLKNVGWLLKEDSDKVVIAVAQNENGDYAAFHCFPRGCVTSITRLSSS